MQENVSIQLFWIVIGSLSGVFSGLVVYLFNAIKGIEQSLDAHRSFDDERFAKSQRENDSEHAKMREETLKLFGNSTQDVINLQGQITLMNEKLKNMNEILQEIKEIVKNSIEK